MERAKSIGEWMTERGINLNTLIASTPLDRKVIEALVGGRYTPSPQQRQLLAAALGVDTESIAWGHSAQVQHIYGHGPQFGRSP